MIKTIENVIRLLSGAEPEVFLINIRLNKCIEDDGRYFEHFVSYLWLNWK